MDAEIRRFGVQDENGCIVSLVEMQRIVEPGRHGGDLRSFRLATGEPVTQLGPQVYEVMVTGVRLRESG